MAAKLHVVYDPAAQKPVYFDITPARINDITAAKDLLPIEPGATYVFDLGYYDFAWWAGLAAAGCTFVTRLKTNTPLRGRSRARSLQAGSCCPTRWACCRCGSASADAIRSVKPAVR